MRSSEYSTGREQSGLRKTLRDWRDFLDNYRSMSKSEKRMVKLSFAALMFTVACRLTGQPVEGSQSYEPSMPPNSPPTLPSGDEYGWLPKEVSTEDWEHMVISENGGYLLEHIAEAFGHGDEANPAEYLLNTYGDFSAVVRGQRPEVVSGTDMRLIEVGFVFKNEWGALFAGAVEGLSMVHPGDAVLAGSTDQINEMTRLTGSDMPGKLDLLVYATGQRTTDNGVIKETLLITISRGDSRDPSNYRGSENLYFRLEKNQATGDWYIVEDNGQTASIPVESVTWDDLLAKNAPYVQEISDN